MITGGPSAWASLDRPFGARRPTPPEVSIRGRSLAFYRNALANYVADTKASLSLTIDRSFSRLPQD